MSRAIAFINPRLTTTNVGDIFIEDSLKRILDFDPERSIDVDPRVPVAPDTIDRINACDAAVIVGTNLWYRHLRAPGRWTFTTDDLDRIRVPIVPIGIGTTRHIGEDNGFDDETLDQLRRLHASCTLASVRDERTAEALAEAGIDNVVMTGCPTLYRSLRPDWTLRTCASRRVGVTVRKGQRGNVRTLLRMLRAGGREPIVAAQQPKDVAFRRAIPLVQRATPTIHEYSIDPYLALIEDSVGSIGWRLHGNMLQLAHGKPAVFFANCSRAESFCATFGLPCVRAEDGTRIDDGTIAAAIARLDDAAVYAPLARSYPRYRAEMARCLDANGLAHRLTAAAGAEAADDASPAAPGAATS